MNNIDAVIFDIGNVLIEWHPENFYDQTVGTERRKAFFSAIDIHSHHLEIDKGAALLDTVNSLIPRFPEWEHELRMWHDNWNEIAAPEISHSARLLCELKRKGITVFTLTNFGHDNFPRSQDAYPFLKEFDREYVSGRLKMIKPDPEIYQYVEQDCGLNPERLLFTDDRAENIKAAADRGWKTHLFTDPQGWANRLVAEGLLSTEDAK